MKQALATTRLLTLVGAGGVGKTRLALETADSVADEYADGVWLVELASLADPNLVPQAVATALGIREQPGRPLIAPLLDSLHTLRLLLVLDNCEHLVEASAELVGQLLRACPGVRVLATSREPLAIAGETVWRVSTLRLPSRTDLSPEELRTFEAVQLFVDRARGALPAFGLTRQNAPAIALICRRLDGLPLAIELAAARLNVLTAEQIATRLTDRLRLLVGGKRLAPARQQTLKATIDWSYDLLSDAERRLFQALAVFAGGCSLDAVEAVRDGSSVEATARLDVLGQLIDKSLVVAKPDSDGTVRYVLHETLREYGVERLAGSGELEEARRRHASYYAGFVQPAEAELRGQDQARWLHELGREHDNLRAALGWALERGAGAVGAQFGAALWRFWVYRGFLAEAEASLTRVLALPGPDTSTRLQVLLGAAILAHSSGDMIRTRALFEDLHKRASNIGDARLTAAALMQLGQIARATGDLVRARALLTESLAVWQDLNESRGIAQSLESLGALALTEGDRPMARRLLTEALEITRSVADATKVGFVLCWLGWEPWQRVTSPRPARNSVRG